jgi:acetylornithine deacetylase/succinyl-diaminopimelate desuccinylase-like protein
MEDREILREATELTRDLIRVDTSNPPGRETPAAMLLKDYLEASGVECELVAKEPDRANLVARIRGRGEAPSLAICGHTDVVPADAADWTHPPFSGHVDDEGYLWGRGAVDMKGETATRALTMALLARSGFQPRGDLTFIAQADEEDGIQDVGMSWLVRHRPDLRVDYSLDEGGGSLLELADGRRVVTILVGEKATLPVAVTALGEAGHASTPTAGANAVPRLAELVRRIAAFEPERRLLPVTRSMLEALVGDVGDLDAAIARGIALHPSFEHGLPALFSTTMAPTRLKGSDALNVMPGRATVDVDCRILPGTTPAALEAEVRAALGDDLPFELEQMDEVTGGTVAPIGTPLYDACASFIAENDPGAVLLPTLSTGFTDGHYLREAWGTTAYGFWPFRRTPIAVVDAGVHNRDERIHTEDLAYAVRFHLHAVHAMLGTR